MVRVVQGNFLATFTEPTKMIRLCAHELYRVFYDRLIDDSDRAWFFENLQENLASHFNYGFESIFEHLKGQDGSVTDDNLRSLMFGDYIEPDATNRVYDEVLVVPKIADVIKSKLDDYNQISKAPMNLVIFRFAVEHISRISRIRMTCAFSLSRKQ